jgi:cell division protein FtsB
MVSGKGLILEAARKRYQVSEKGEKAYASASGRINIL